MKYLLFFLLFPLCASSQCDSIVHGYRFDTTQTIPIYKQLTVDGNITQYYYTGGDTVIVCSLCGVKDTTFDVPCPVEPVIIEYGAFILGSVGTTIQQKSDSVLNFYQIPYYRYNYDYTTGGTWQIPYLHSKPLKVSLSFQYVPFSTLVPFPDSATYGAALRSKLALGAPEYLHIINEPSHKDTNKSVSQMLAYVKCLRAGGKAGHAVGSLVSDGGMTQGIYYAMLDDYKVRGKIDSFNIVANLMSVNTRTYPNAFIQKELAWYKPYLDTLNTLRAQGLIDFANLHHYEPFRSDTSITQLSGLLTLVCNFITRKTGLQVITNEFGSRNHNAQLLTDLLTEMKQVRMPLQIYFDGSNTVDMLAVAQPYTYKYFIHGAP
jgi:hypothetical protein